MGDRLIYRDTFEQALADLTGGPGPSPPAATAAAASSPAAAPTPASIQQPSTALAERISHLRDQAEQLAKELDALQKETQKK
jgi:hypothetical protein